MTGIANVSNGKAFNWYGDGKTEFSVGTKLDVSYGVKTEVSVGAKSEFSITGKTGVTVGSKFEASLALEMSFSKKKSIATAKDGGFHVMDAYVGTVGHNATQIAAVKTLREAVSILLAVQATAMAVVAGAVILRKINDPNTKEEMLIPTTGVNLGYLISIITLAATITPALAVFVDKLVTTTKKNDPSCILSMDTVGTMFMGTRATAPPNSSAGLLLDNTKAQLSAAPSNLVFNRSGKGNTALGFTKTAGTPPVGGARLEVCNNGVTQVFGTSLTAELADTTSPTNFNVKAQNHDLAVTTQGSLTAAGPALSLNSKGALLKHDEKNNLVVNANGVSALAGGPTGASFNLNAQSASLGSAGNNLMINASGLVLGFGQTTLRLDATGLSIGNNLTILNPGPPAVTYQGLQKALQDVTLLNAAVKSNDALLTLSLKKQIALDKATTTLNDTLVKTRERIEEVAESIPKRPAGTSA